MNEQTNSLAAAPCAAAHLESRLGDRVLPSPREIIAHLDRRVFGQARAKQDLAVSVYNHFLGRAYKDRTGVDLGRQHILLIGPTGVGKTYLVRTLAEFLNVPIGFCSATGLVEAGYKGRSVDTLVKTLLDRSEGDPKRAERGIVFVDEIDKIKRCEMPDTRDISGEGVQNALLTLLDGCIAEGAEGSQHSPVDTSNLLFICTGAFVGLDKIVKARIGSAVSKIGFGVAETEVPQGVPGQPVYENLRRAETRDLVEFGLIPELIGRFAKLSVCHELGRDALRSILGATVERSALERQQELAKIHGIELEIAEDALDAIAAEAESLGTGARGLHRLVGQVVDDVDHRWSELADQGVAKVIIDGRVARGEAGAELVQGNDLAGDRIDHELRREAFRGLPSRPIADASEESQVDSDGITDTSGWNQGRLKEEIDRVKVESLAWSETTGSAKKWWEAFESENQHRLALVLRLAEELRTREASITDFFLAYVYSNTENIQANLHYLDFARLKKKDERDRRKGSEE